MQNIFYLGIILFILGIIIEPLIIASAQTSQQSQMDYATGYQNLQQQPFTRIPTVCALKPIYDYSSSSPLPLDQYQDAIKNDISEWSSLLAATTPHPQNWNIKYV